jgi:hypothetical protein
MRYKKIKKQYRIIEINFDDENYHAELEYYLNGGWELHGETSLFQHNGKLKGIQPIVRTNVEIKTELPNESIEAHKI